LDAGANSGDEAREAVRAAISDRDPQVQMLAIRTCALWRDTAAFESLTTVLGNEDANVRRSAVAALGKLGDRRAISPLLKVAESKADRFLQHALAFALFEIG
jgi:HEAT repeat protein